MFFSQTPPREREGAQPSQKQDCQTECLGVAYFGCGAKYQQILQRPTLAILSGIILGQLGASILHVNERLIIILCSSLLFGGALLNIWAKDRKYRLEPQNRAHLLEILD